MKKIVTITLVATILTATGITALAAPVTPDSDQKQRNSTVGYDAAPTYSIVIPEEIILKSNDTVEAEITADDIMLEAYQQIEVKLTAASNTESGSTFSAKTADGQSTAIYTITAGEQAVSVGDKIAVFEDAGTQTLTFSKAEGATHAGKHTETLTFTVSVKSTASVDQDGQILNSWADIVAACNDGSYKTKYEIGNWKELDLGEEGIVKMKIVAMDADELADGSGNKAPITWISEQLLNTRHRMNPIHESGTEGTGAIGGWEKSEMRAYLNETILPLITDNESALNPASNGIKAVKKYTRIVNASEEVENNKVTADSVWIPSAREMFGSGPASETMGANYSEVFTDDASRVKKMSGGNAAWWWLRSASSTYYFGSVNTDGSFNGNLAAITGGVALGFCT